MSPILTRLAAPSVVLLTLLAIAGCASAGPEATVKRYAGELGFQLQVPDNEALKPPGGKMEPVGKIERRPMMLVEAEAQGQPIS